jgi:hypothetical protein
MEKVPVDGKEREKFLKEAKRIKNEDDGRNNYK